MDVHNIFIDFYSYKGCVHAFLGHGICNAMQLPKLCMEQ